MKQKIRTLSAPLSQKQYLRHPTHSLDHFTNVKFHLVRYNLKKKVKTFLTGLQNNEYEEYKVKCIRQSNQKLSQHLSLIFSFQVHAKYAVFPRHRRNLAIAGSVSVSILVSPLIAALTVGKYHSPVSSQQVENGYGFI